MFALVTFVLLDNEDLHATRHWHLLTENPCVAADAAGSALQLLGKPCYQCVKSMQDLDAEGSQK